MTELFTLSGYIFAVIIAILYEYHTRNLSAKPKIINLSAKPKNNVHFYVARDMSGSLWLYLGKPIRYGQLFASGRGVVLVSSYKFSKYGLNKNDYDNLKWEDEPVEVVLNLED